MRTSFSVVAAFVVVVGAATPALAVTINIVDLTDGVPVVTADTPLTFVTQIPEFVEFTFHSGFLLNFPGAALGYNILEADNTLSDRLNATLIDPASDVWDVKFDSRDVILIPLVPGSGTIFDSNTPFPAVFNTSSGSFTINVSSDVAETPEPASLTLLAMGLAGLGLRRRKQPRALSRKA